MAHLLRYDSVYGRFHGTVEAGEGELRVNGAPVAALTYPDAAELPWRELGVDVVIESTGRFRTRAGSRRTPRGRSPQGHHFGAGKGRGADRRDDRARRQLR